jgi:hypothetical protein
MQSEPSTSTSKSKKFRKTGSKGSHNPKNWKTFSDATKTELIKYLKSLNPKAPISGTKENLISQIQKQEGTLEQMVTFSTKGKTAPSVSSDSPMTSSDSSQVQAIKLLDAFKRDAETGKMTEAEFKSLADRLMAERKPLVSFPELEEPELPSAAEPSTSFPGLTALKESKQPEPSTSFPSLAILEESMKPEDELNPNSQPVLPQDAVHAPGVDDEEAKPDVDFQAIPRFARGVGRYHPGEGQFMNTFSARSGLFHRQTYAPYEKIAQAHSERRSLLIGGNRY